MAEHLLDAFADAVARHGDRTALVEADGTRISFAALADRSDRMAAGWARHGMHPGDRILIALPVGADLYAALAAIWRLGAVAVLPEPAMGLTGLRHALRSTGVAGLCASGPYRALRLLPGLWRRPLFQPGVARPGAAAPDRPRDPADLALISFTSGTTGAPKAIPRSHAFLMAQHAAVSPLLDSPRAEVDLVAFPVFVLVNLACGRSSVLPNWKMRQLDRVTPAALAAWIDAQGVTRLLLPPALCATLAHAPIPSRVTALFTGGGPVFPDLIAALRASRPDLRIVAVYGSTEAEPIAELDAATVTPEDLARMRAGEGLLAGQPVPATQLRILDDEIVVSGAHVNTGYLDPSRDVETKIRDGATIWHRTGDAGRLDAEGRLWLLGRRGGAVPTAQGPRYPFAIETAARMWPGVRAAAVVAVQGRAVLALTGDAAHLPDWTARAAAFGISDLRHLPNLPMDRRHRSKIDTAALRKRLEG